MDTAIPQTSNRTIQPTLQPISQDDATVSISHPGQQPQQQLQFAQQHELVQPGQTNYDHLQLQTDFRFPQPDQFSPHPHSATQLQSQQMAALGGESTSPSTALLPQEADNSSAEIPQFAPFQQHDLQQPMTPSPHVVQDQFFPPTPQTHHTNISPQLPSQATFQAPMAPPMERAISQMSQQDPPSPSKQQIDDLRDHVEALYGKGVNINISSVLPTPVATPSKRASVSIDKIDASPIPFSLNEVPDVNFAPASGVNMITTMERTMSDQGYASPVFSPTHMSPAQSFLGSPQMTTSQSFDPTMAADGMVFADNTLHSFVSSPPVLLTDVDVSSPQSNSSHFSANSHTPKPTSLAPQNINGCIQATGVDPESISAYISEQDPVTHKWKCLFPKCNHPLFGRRENIRAHVQTHLGDRQFVCNVCQKCFVRQHDLKRHAKIHMGVKDYACLCGSTFARMDALTRHRQRGMCQGGFPGAVRTEKKRGRPKKNRPEMDDRVTKANTQRQRNAHRRNNSDFSDSVSAASSPVSISSPSPIIHQAEFASLDAAASPASSPAEDIMMPIVTSSMENASLESTALNVSTMSTGSANDLAGDTSFDMSALISTEPNVAAATSTEMQRSNSDSADSYTTIFDSPTWESELAAHAGNAGGAISTQSTLNFEYATSFPDLTPPPSPTKGSRAARSMAGGSPAVAFAAAAAAAKAAAASLGAAAFTPPASSVKRTSAARPYVSPYGPAPA